MKASRSFETSVNHLPSDSLKSQRTAVLTENLAAFSFYVVRNTPPKGNKRCLMNFYQPVHAEWPGGVLWPLPPFDCRCPRPPLYPSGVTCCWRDPALSSILTPLWSSYRTRKNYSCCLYLSPPSLFSRQLSALSDSPLTGRPLTNKQTNRQTDSPLTGRPLTNTNRQTDRQREPRHITIPTIHACKIHNRNFNTHSYAHCCQNLPKLM
jgi:hypothetical protein